MIRRRFVGNGSLERLGDLLDALRSSRILLITGRRSFDSSGARELLAPFISDSVVERFSDFGSSPNLADATKGRDLAQQFEPDLILAVGGGSVIDTAKLVNTLAAQTAEPLEIVTGRTSIECPGVPLVAISTTAGTGSEATHFAVVYVGTDKYSLAHPSILPTFAIVDPVLTRALSPYLTASCGFDALSQAIESFWAVGATDESQRFAREAITRCMRSLAQAVRHPSDRAREDMARAAHLAGQAINISKTTGAHALSYPLTVHHGIHHGHAVALTLGRWFVFNAASGGRSNDPRGADYHQRVMRDLCALIGGDDAEQCRRILHELMVEVGLETDLARLGISGGADLERIVNDVNLERLGNNPVEISRPELFELVSGP
ncbi:MAG: phosphonoacetaldehyde reductase [bacterium]|nr:phosphonoacetaldehyde reductase [bacterium]